MSIRSFYSQLLLVVSFAIFSCAPEELSAQSTKSTSKFGVQFLDTIFLPSPLTGVGNVSITQVDKRKTRNFYNDPASQAILDSTTIRGVKISNRQDSIVTILIPPLLPNRLYRLNYDQYGELNFYTLMYEIHTEKSSLSNDSLNWFKSVHRYNQTSPFMLLYHPQVEFSLFQESLKGIQNFDKWLMSRQEAKNENPASNFDSAKAVMIDSIVVGQFYKYFPTYRFKRGDLTKSKIHKAVAWIAKQKSFGPESIFVLAEFVGTIPDYDNIYSFYSTYLKKEMDNPKYLDFSKLVELVNAQLDTFLVRTKKNVPANTVLALSNFSQAAKAAVKYAKNQTKSTFPKDFKTGYERRLIPDFGYALYLPGEGSIPGGVPFVGVHIPLAASNKDVPLRLSKFRIVDRISVHTGITINSLKKDRFREDLFDGFSLLIGGSVKVLSHATRINGGIVLFKDIDPISAKSSFGVQPYVGLSFDLEIRAWLEKNIKPLGTIFKKDD